MGRHNAKGTRLCPPLVITSRKHIFGCLFAALSQCRRVQKKLGTAAVLVLNNPPPPSCITGDISVRLCLRKYGKRGPLDRSSQP